ncbi:hypothetical protein CEXT_425231 [Caerostris extrusa]|uniref:Uncharacterized protein n=1 Tax=Caerostris extrusa TaxID=172846 RepID=A0AAV4X1G0_CAEEX|nr:hypothetical protein CEXT_425231 [Caerostris extrusa]
MTFPKPMQIILLLKKCPKSFNAHDLKGALTDSRKPEASGQFSSGELTEIHSLIKKLIPAPFSHVCPRGPITERASFSL